MNTKISISPQFKPYLLLLMSALATLFMSACTEQTVSEVADIVSSAVPAEITTTPTIVKEEAPLPKETQPPDVTQAPAATSTATPLPSHPAEPVGGIELHKITEQRGLGLLRETNTYWIRRNGLFWSAVEPNPGDRNWAAIAELETELQTASEQGYQVILIIRDAPTWARTIPDYHCGPVKSEQLNAFASFIHDAVARYSVPPYNVKFWELGNEPDVSYEQIPPTMPFGCWGDFNDPYFGGGYYAEMLKTVYPQIKAANPEAEVVVGGLLLDCNPINPPETSPGSGEFKNCISAQFMEGILRNGGGDFFDGISFHAYDYYYEIYHQYGNPNWQSTWNTTGPALIAKTDYLRSLLGIYGHPNKFLMNTETALICARDEKEPVCQTDEFDKTKGNYAAQSYAAALAKGLRANIWYSITGWRGSGLVKSNMQPTFASTAYAFSLQMLDQAAYRGKITEFQGLAGYQFERSGTPLWVIWSIQENPSTIELPALPQAMYDVYGNPLPTAQNIEVSTEVIYIEFAP
jgi:hypothetical protein